MDRTVTESTPGAAPVVAPSSQDREAIAAEQDQAWADDKTDVGAGEVAADGAVKEDDGVITDKPGMAAVTPAPKPGAVVAGESGEPAAKSDDSKTDEAAAAQVVTPEQKAADYWKKVKEVHPDALSVVDTPKFKAWYAGLSDVDKAVAADLDKPDEAVRLMGRFYADVTAGRVKEPEPPAPPKAFEIGEYLTGRKISDLKIKKADGTETTLGAMAAPEEFGEIIGAMGAIQSASEQAIVNHFGGLIQQLTGKIEQLQERLGASDLAAKVPDAPSVVNDPAFAAFRDRSPLLKNAWASGDADQRAEVISMFRADKARATVADASLNQRRSNAAKGDLHRGTLRGGAPGTSRTQDDKTVGQEQDAAWDTPIEVEGAKV